MILLLTSAALLRDVGLTPPACQQLKHASNIVPVSLFTAEVLSQMPSIALRHDEAHRF